MPFEIERKFLVEGNFKPFSIEKKKIVQGYLSLDPRRSVRIRIVDNQAFLTVKGNSSDDGLSRFEWEISIDQVEAAKLLNMCEGSLVEKYRYIVPVDSGLQFEIDEFSGRNEGLLIAEIELPDENFSFVKPSWLGKEITGNLEYYNIFLATKPYDSWEKE